MSSSQLEQHRSSVVSDTKWFASSLYLARFLALPCAIITARLLGPYLYGTWKALRLILTYASFLQMGLFDGLTREIPYLKGSGNTDVINRFKESSFTVSILVGTAGAIILFAASFVMQGGCSPLVIRGIRIMAVVVLFYHLYGFYDYLLRAEQNFILVSRTKILYASGSAILQVIGVLVYGIDGLFFSLIVVNSCIVLFLFRLKPICLRIPNFQIIIRLMRSGIPMLLNGMADVLLHTADRLIILAFLTREELGFYAIALLAASFVDFIPGSFQSVLLPRIMRQTGALNTSDELGKFWLRPLYILAFVLPVLVGFVWILAPMVLLVFLPQYLPGLNALKILIIGMCFASIPNLTRNLFVAVNKQYRVLGVFAVTLAMDVALNYLFIKLGLGITGVALATSLSFLLFGVLLLGMALSLEKQCGELPKILVRLYGPTLGITAVLVFLETLFPVALSFPRELMMIGVKLSIYVVLLIPVLYFFDRKTGLISEVAFWTKRTSQ